MLPRKQQTCRLPGPQGGGGVPTGLRAGQATSGATGPAVVLHFRGHDKRTGTTGAEGKGPKGQACRSARLAKGRALTAHTPSHLPEARGALEHSVLDPRAPKNRVKGPWGQMGSPAPGVSSKNEKPLRCCKFFHLQMRSA